MEKKNDTRSKKKIASDKRNFKKRLDLPSAKRPNAKPVKYGNEERSVREWASVRNISYTAMRNRLAKYPPEIALNPDFGYEMAMKIYNCEAKNGKAKKTVAKKSTTRRKVAKHG